MNRLSARITLALTVVASLLSVTCSHAIDAPAKASASQRLKAIIEDNYHPYSFINEKGHPDGFSVEIAHAAAKAMDLELEMRAENWDVALKELETGQIDLITVIAHSPEREKVFNFSVPYTVVYDAIFFRKGTSGISSLKDLAGKTVIVTTNDLAHNYLVSSGLSKTMNIVLVKSGPDALKQLAAGKGDVAIMPKLIGLVTVKKLNLADIEASPQLVDAYTRSWGFAVKAGNLALLERLNQGLNIIKSSGEYDAIYKKWFGALEESHFNLKMVFRYGSFALLIFLAIIAWDVMLKRQVKAQTDNLVAEIGQRQQAEELLRESGAALRESEGRYRKVFEDANDGMALADAETGLLVDCNQALCRMVERDKAELVGEPESILHPPEIGADNLSQAFRQHAAGDLQDGLEAHLLSKSGKIFTVDIRASRVRIGGREFLLGIFRNITERKQAEAQLTNSNEELNRFNRLMAGRELRTIELKQQVNELAAQLGQPRPYPLAFLDAAATELVRTTPKPPDQNSKSSENQKGKSP